MDQVPDWKGSPTKPVNKSAPNLSIRINGKTILHETKSFTFSEYSYSIPKKFRGSYSSTSQKKRLLTELVTENISIFFCIITTYF